MVVAINKLILNLFFVRMILVIMLKIEKIIVGFLRTNCYILKKDNKCMIIDPGDESEKIKEACAGYEVEEILVTHHHFDHVLALEDLEKEYHTKHNQFLRKTFQYEIIKTPGHTSDSLTFYFKDDKSMFTGDFLFYHTIGRCDLETSSIEDMKQSLEKIENYPDDITIYPGHGKSSILGEEKTLFDTYF